MYQQLKTELCKTR